MSDDAKTFLEEAYRVALNSPDPSTQNGAIIVSRDGRVISRGFNGFPRRVASNLSRLKRPEKYLYVEHAERAAVYAAAYAGEQCQGTTMYCPWFACVDCARAIICSGITGVVGDARRLRMDNSRWKASIAVAEEMLTESGVTLAYWDGDLDAEPILIDGQWWTP